MGNPAYFGSYYGADFMNAFGEGVSGRVHTSQAFLLFPLRAPRISLLRIHKSRYGTH